MTWSLVARPNPHLAPRTFARLAFLLLALLLLLLTASAVGQSIVTVAGGGNDDGRLATQVRLQSPSGVVKTADGTIFFADRMAQKVRKVDAGGRIGTVAGTGLAGFSGDGGPATLAALQFPSALIDDGRGGLLVADLTNDRIRRIDLASGRIETIAGGGLVPGAAGDGLPATQVSLGFPVGLARDAAGNLYVTQSTPVLVRRIDAATKRISTIAGTGQAGFSGDGGPATQARFDTLAGIAVDAAGNVFLADNGNRRIRRIDASSRVVTTVAGDGTTVVQDGAPATASGLWSPLSVAVRPGGDLCIGDVDGVRLVSAATGRMQRVAWFGNPSGLFLDGPSRLLVAEGLPDVAGVYSLDLTSGAKAALAGGTATAFGDGGPATAENLLTPQSANPDSNGDLLVAEMYGRRLRKVSRSDGRISTFAGTGRLGGASPDGTPATAASFEFPTRTARDGAGNVFVVDAGYARLFRIDAASGLLRTVAGTDDPSQGDGAPATRVRLAEPEGVAVDGAGNLFVTELATSRVRKIDGATGILTTVAGTGTPGLSGDGGPATRAQLTEPWDVAFDPQGNLLVADTWNGRLRRVDSRTGVISTVAGGGGTFPEGPVLPTQAALPALTDVAVDSRGNLFIGANARVFRLDAGTGFLSPFAGAQPPMEAVGVGSTGDGGPATRATFAFVSSVDVDRNGNVFIADPYSNRIRAVYACVTVAAPTLTAPADRATDVSTGPTLTWNAVPGAFRYDVVLDAPYQTNHIVASDLAATSFKPVNLLPGTLYLWLVVAKGDPFCTPKTSAASSVHSFTTAGGCSAPPAPSLSSPADGATGVPASTTLAWTASAGAGSYELYFGSTNPPPLRASALTTTSYAVSGLVPSATLFWSVVAHASCDTAKTSSSPVRSFRVAGTACAPPGAFSLTAPADRATGVPATATLTWTTSPNASSYDVFLGLGGSLPLYLSGVTATSLAVPGLSAGATYSWKVVARTSCDASAAFASPVRTFTVAGTCATPGAPSFSFVPPGAVGAGQSYVVAWRAAPGLDAAGGYLVERSTSPSFSPLLDVQATSSLFAAFVAGAPGTLYHRVKAVAGCDPSKVSSPSATGTVTVVAAPPSVVFSVAPTAVVTSLGERLEDQKTLFVLENVTTSPITVIVSRMELASVPFFTVVDPDGGDPAFVTLAPRTPKRFELRFSGPPKDAAGTYQGLVVVSAVGAGLAVTPYAFVNLKVGGSPDAVPEFRVGGRATESVFFPGLSGDDTGRPPLSVDLYNPGSSPLELAAEVGPEVWLTLEPGWNATPVPARSSRTLRLSTMRLRAPNGSALPRYTYLTLRTKGGATARLLVQDNDKPGTGTGRATALARGERSVLVPSVVNAGSAIGGSFVSRLRLSNASSEAIQAELLFTPASTDSLTVDGFDPVRVSRATVLVPPRDLVNLTDPLVQLFGLTPPVSGSLEVRTDPSRAGFLTVTSAVDAPARSGGTFGFQMPTVLRGEGARLGSPHVLTGVTHSAGYRTNLILAETTGLDAATVRVSLVSSAGTKLGETTVSVPRYGQRQISRVVPSLGGSEPFSAGRLEVEVLSGGGSVVAVVTVIDNLNDDAVTYVGTPASGAAPSFVARLAAHTPGSRPFGTSGSTSAAGTVSLVVPAVVNGFSTFPGTGQPYTFRSLLGLAAGTASSATFQLRYHDVVTGKDLTRSVTVEPRKTREYANVLEELFGVGAGAQSQGPLFVSASGGGTVYCKVYSNLAQGTLGDSFPVIPVPSDALTGTANAVPVSLDGLEQSVDRSRGTRSNLLLNEVLGQSASVTVSLYEAGNRSTPIASRDVGLLPYEKVQLSSVFTDLGLDSDTRRKDRANVLCVVTPRSGSGLVSAIVTTIDNKTGDTRNAPLTPTGGLPAAGGAIGF